jgi:hypothetical protein
MVIPSSRWYADRKRMGIRVIPLWRRLFPAGAASIIGRSFRRAKLGARF